MVTGLHNSPGYKFPPQFPPQSPSQSSPVKCGIALPIDGSQDGLINVRGLNNYSVPPWQSNLQLHPQDAAPAYPPPDSDSKYRSEEHTSELQSRP